MSEHHGSGRHDSMAGRALTAVGVMILVAVILVQSGAWDTVVDKVGVGRTVGSTQALRPQAQDRTRNDLHLPSPPQATGTPGHDGDDGRHAGTFIPAAVSPVPIDQAIRDAQTLPAAQAHPQGYSRERDFGSWTHAPGLCGEGTTRDLVLRRDLRDVVSDGRCKVRSGVFDDPYTGTVMHFRYGRDTSALVQVDHVVALKDAWASGLWRADHARRVAYANDPDVLLASNGQQNVAKGDGLDYGAARDPVWLPENRAWHCDYVAKRVEIKRKYGLSMTPSEKRQTVGILSSCAAGSYR